MDTNKFTFEKSSQTVNEPHDPDLQAQIDVKLRNDYGFLEVLLSLDDSASTKPGFPQHFSVKFPNILQKARDMDSTNLHYSFYDETTYIEFHLLLLDLLRRVKIVVQSLSDLRKFDLRGRPTDAATFKANVDDGRLYGYLLMRLARGEAFGQHMENIEPLLTNYIHATNASAQAAPSPVLAPVSDKATEMKDRLGRDEEAEEATAEAEKEINKEINEEIDDMEEIPLEQKGLLSTAFGSWLRLMVIPLDAAEITIAFVNDSQFPFREISIQLLIPPITSSESLPWRTLLNNATFFPKSDPLQLNGPTNAKLEEFLDMKIQAATFSTRSHAFSQHVQKSWKGKSISQTLKYLEDLKLLTFPDDRSKELVSQLIDAIKTLEKNQQKDRKGKWIEYTKKLSPESSAQGKTSASPIILSKDSDLDSIGTRIASLTTLYPEPPAGSSFFMEFAKENSFGGTLHCEAFMATLIDNATHHGTYDEGWNLHTSEMQVNHIFPCFCYQSYSHCITLTGIRKNYWSVKTLLPGLLSLP